MSVFGLQHPCKALGSVIDEEKNKWFVGTCSLKNDNQLLLIEYDEETEELSHTDYSFKNYILNLYPSTKDASLLYIVSEETCLYKVGDSIEQKLTLGKFSSLCLDPFNGTDVIAINAHSINLMSQDKILSSKKCSPSCGAWSIDYQVAYGQGKDVIGWDSKSCKETFTIQNANEVFVRCVDFNPNKTHCLLTGGDDGSISIWDTRNTQLPLYSVTHHSHWIWQCAYNKSYDQLLLTCGSDALVILESVVGCSSAPLMEHLSESSEEIGRPIDECVGVFDQHEDSIYAVSWSQADPWLFASVSFDKRFVVNKVPRDHKLKIIL